MSPSLGWKALWFFYGQWVRMLGQDAGICQGSASPFIFHHMQSPNNNPDICLKGADFHCPLGLGSTPAHPPSSAGAFVFLETEGEECERVLGLSAYKSISQWSEKGWLCFITFLGRNCSQWWIKSSHLPQGWIPLGLVNEAKIYLFLKRVCGKPLLK